MNSPPPSRIRLTIPVTPEVHAVYKRMAEVSGRSIGAEMGEMLLQTLPAAEHMTTLVEQVRVSPRRGLEDIKHFTNTMDAFERILKESAGGAASPAVRRGSAAGGRVAPPSSNTGGKGPKTHKRVNP